MNSVRLRLARTAAGLSLQALADRIDKLVTAQVIGKYERGEANPGSKVLLALARALDVPVDYLLADDDLVVEDVGVGKKQVVGRKAAAKVEVTVLTQMERYLAVEELLGLPVADWDRPREAPYPVLRDVAEADRAAESLRGAWELRSAPVPNLVDLLERRGVKVLTMEVEDIDGLTVRIRRRGHRAAPVVLVNPIQPDERRRITLARELGRLAMEVAPNLDDEAAAHRFARAFLIPAEVLWLEMGKRRSTVSVGELAELQRVFGVGAHPLLDRCKDLGIISATLCASLSSELKRAGWHTAPYEELSAASTKTATRFERLCLRALAEDAVSESRGAELLAVSVRELGERMEPTAKTHG